jgi:hypothetical protein
MDGTAAINHNLEALKRILAGLVAMAGMIGQSPPLRGFEARSSDRGSIVGREGRGDCEAIGDPGNRRGPGLTLPRHLYRAILRLLRPAEAAARRLIIAAARGLVVPPPPPRKSRPKPMTAEPLLRRFGIAVVMSSADLAGVSILPRSRRTVPSPELVEGSKGGGVEPSPLRIPSLSLFDPPRRFRSNARRTVPAHAAPRILFPGVTEPFCLPPPPARPSPDDPIDAARLALRLASLAAALDDLPGQARRFARWKSARDAAGAQDKNRDAAGAQSKNRDTRRNEVAGWFRRSSPLRLGRPPGGRLSRYDPTARRRHNIREIDEVLAHAHALAIYALAHPDTS